MAAGHHFGNLGMSGGKNSINFSEIGNSGILFEFQTVNIIGGFGWFVVLHVWTYHCCEKCSHEILVIISLYWVLIDSQCFKVLLSK